VREAFAGGEIVSGIAIIGAGAQGEAVLVDCFGVAAKARESVAEVHANLGVCGVDGADFGEFAGSLAWIARLKECEAEFVMGVRIGRGDLDRLAELADGLRDASLLMEDGAEIAAGEGILTGGLQGVCPERLAIALNLGLTPGGNGERAKNRVLRPGLG
jgi:hypothetical protein